jgi:hypothetical protein
MVADRAGVLERVNAVLAATDSPSIAEHCFRIASLYQETATSRLARGIELRHFFRFFPELSKMDQRLSITTLSRLAAKVSNLEFGPHFDQISALLNHDDPLIRRPAAALVSALAPQIPGRFVRIEPVCQIIDATADVEVARALIALFGQMCQHQRWLRALRARPPDFQRLLFSFDDARLSHEILKFIQILLPTPNLHPSLWPSVRRSSDGAEVVRLVEPPVRR